MKKKPIAYVGTSILLFSTLMPTGIVFAESITIEAPTEQTGATLESVQSDIKVPEKQESAPVSSQEANPEEETTESSVPQETEEKEETKEEAVVPNMTLKRKGSDKIEAGDKIELKLFGNLTQAALSLPEGLVFDEKDHLDGENKLSEDFAWNEEKRELTIKNIAEEEAAATTFFLTAEKAGHYELTVFDEAADYESEKLAFDVEEKEEVKEETEESKEATKETTESSKEEKQENKKATKTKKAPRANEVIVGINADTTFRTYTNPVTGIAPTEYAVAVPLSISTAGIKGVKVEIPYGFTPDTTNPIFKDFEMTDPIFSLVTPAAPAADSVVDHYENDTTNQKLIIHLKETKTTVETVNLRFKFNSDYDAKIPADQIIWQDLQATAYDSSAAQLSQSSKVQLKSNALNGIETTLNLFNPKTTDYTTGPITNRMELKNNHNKQWLLDGTAKNRAFVEVPTGSVLSTNMTDYFGTDGKTTSDDSSIPTGYTRYYRDIADQSSDFNLWQLAGNVNVNKQQMDTQFTPPSSIAENDSFSITIGMITKKINAKATTVTDTVTYTKKAQPDWELTHGLKVHNTGVSGDRKAVVILDKPASTSRPNYVIGFSTYPHTNTYKNTGKRDITGTSFTLYQKSTGSEKINFNGITIHGTTLDNTVAKSYYQAEFEITNSTGTSRTETTTPKSGVHSLTLPALATGEYISKVTVTPMGTDGTTVGAWPTGNGFAFGYSAKNWDNGKWPDGSTIPTDKLSKVQMGGYLTYDNEENGQAPASTSIEMNSAEVIYAPDYTTDAYANFTSGDANSRQPGDTVNYEIQGYNTLHAISDWKNPIISVAIPKVLEMQDPGNNKDFYDEKNGVNHPGAVQVELLNSDATYNYYRFKVTGDGPQVEAGVAFKIPVAFKVASGTPVGNYPIPAVAASSDKFLQMDRATNNFSDGMAKNLGHDNTVLGSYSGRTSSSHTQLSIVYASKLNGDSAGRAASGDAWTETTHFAVDKKGTPQMKATINNIGNTSFTSVRLYDILPSSSDGRGSTGNIDFTGLDSSTGTVYYTTQPISSLPDYSTDLQTWNAAKLASHGFSTTPPLDIKDVTAIYIDFGSHIVAPNDKLDTVMNFLVPDADNQKAVNQFQYSAKEIGLNTVLNAKSSEITFSTEVAKVAYDENLPSFMAPGETAAGNMPDDQAVLLDTSGKGSITLSTKKPTMTGYTFVKWQDKANASKEYQPGDKIDFTSASTELNLKAIWKAVSVNVTYKKNDGSTANADVKAYNFGDTVSLSAVTNPTRTGYQFKGWGTTATAVTADFTDGTQIDFVTDKTVYAIWEANAYSVQFDKNNGTGSMTDQAFTYDIAAKLKKNTFTRPGYKFTGWAKAANAVSAEYTDEASVSNLSTANNGVVKLFAIWEAQDQTIQFDVNGGDLSSKPNDIIEKTDTNVDISKVAAPTRKGYTFDGWYDGATAVTGTIKMPAGGMILKAAWKANKYKVEFDANKGTGTMTAQQFTYDAAQNLTANTFTRSGYSFVGWATSSTGKSAYVDQESVNNLTAKDGDTIKLYAVWSATAQVLQFDVNGGDPATKPGNINSSTDAVVDISSVKAPTRKGYKFTGWYDGATKVGNSIVMPVGGKTLKAEWEAISYKVNFHANTGKSTMAKQAFVYDAAQNLTKNTFTKDGYAFDGWSKAQNSLGYDYVDEQNVMNLSDTHDAEVTVYASWRALDQTVTFDVNGGDVATKPLDIVQVTDSAVDISTVVSPTRTGYKFAGWYDGATKATNTFKMPAGGKTLRAEWTPIEYSIEFDGNSGTGTMAAQKFDYDLNQSLRKNEFTKAGYSFTGWSTKKGDPIVYSDEQAVQNLTATDGDKITLFANWKADDQTITFDVNGGDEATKPANLVAPTDSTVDLTKVKAPTRTGYTFKGWYEAAAKSDDSFAMPAGGKNLRAEWTPISYKIVFDGNSGAGTMADQAFEYDTEQKLTKNKFTKAGYSFTGWASKKDGKVEFTDEQALKNLTATADDKITVYAIWEAEDQTIKFDVNGGDEASRPENIVAKTGEKVDIDKVKAPTRTGYEFAGWYLKDKKISGVIEMPVGGMTLVAKWTKKDDPGKLPGTSDSGTGTSISRSTYLSGRIYRGTDTSAKNLPKTGSESQSPLTVILGLCILAGTTILAWLRRSKKDTEE
ncbi:InlB B-repeat-containing protein [Enterococcus sp. AZ007]|uniref:InlB B-repeat-containing protein n=1 Tax=Enterococcus sp. AZ007 TaxID=2774839 RepID=UPI003F22FE87